MAARSAQPADHGAGPAGAVGIAVGSSELGGEARGGPRACDEAVRGELVGGLGQAGAVPSGAGDGDVAEPLEQWGVQRRGEPGDPLARGPIGIPIGELDQVAHLEQGGTGRVGLGSGGEQARGAGGGLTPRAGDDAGRPVGEAGTIARWGFGKRSSASTASLTRPASQSATTSQAQASAWKTPLPWLCWTTASRSRDTAVSWSPRRCATIPAINAQSYGAGWAFGVAGGAGQRPVDGWARGSEVSSPRHSRVNAELGA